MPFFIIMLSITVVIFRKNEVPILNFCQQMNLGNSHILMTSDRKLYLVSSSIKPQVERRCASPSELSLTLLLTFKIFVLFWFLFNMPSLWSHSGFCQVPNEQPLGTAATGFTGSGVAGGGRGRRSRPLNPPKSGTFNMS